MIVTMTPLELSRAIRALDRLALPELQKLRDYLENDLKTRKFRELDSGKSALARCDPDYPPEAWLEAAFADL